MIGGLGSPKRTSWAFGFHIDDMRVMGQVEPLKSPDADPYSDHGRFWGRGQPLPSNTFFAMAFSNFLRCSTVLRKNSP